MQEHQMLEKLWSDWRQEMLHAVGTRDRLAELECHLRDAMDHEMANGLDELSAFSLCSKKLGSLEDFAMQYPKPTKFVNRIALESTRIAWFLGFLVAIFFLVMKPDFLTLHAISLLLGYWTLFCCMLLGVWILATKNGPDGFKNHYNPLKLSLVRAIGLAAITFSLGIWAGMIWARENRGTYWSNDSKEWMPLVITLVSWACWLVCSRKQLNLRQIACLILFAFTIGIWTYCFPVYWSFENSHTYGYSGFPRWILVALPLVMTLFFFVLTMLNYKSLPNSPNPDLHL